MRVHVIKPLLFAAATWVAALPALAKEPLILISPIAREATFARNALTLICTDAFRRLGVDFKIRHYPALRASVEADAGSIDGEIGRAIHYGADHPTLVRVEEPLLTLKVAAFAKTPGIKIDGWDSLKGSPLRVEYRAGYPLYKLRLEQRLPAAQIGSVIDASAGMQRLALGRSDLYIDMQEYGRFLLNNNPGRHGALYEAGLLEMLPVYFYLHQRHAALAPRLAQTLRQMKADGVLERYVNLALQAEAPAAAR